MKNYKIQENKISNILSTIAFVIFLIGLIGGLLITPFISIDYGLATFLLSLPITAIFFLVSGEVSSIKEDTARFLNDIENKLSKAKTIKELRTINNELVSEAIEVIGDRHMIRLAYPLRIKSILNEIKHKIEILEIQ